MLQAIFYCGNSLFLPDLLRKILLQCLFLLIMCHLNFLFIFLMGKDVSGSLGSVWAFACVFLLHFALVFPKTHENTKTK